MAPKASGHALPHAGQEIVLLQNDNSHFLRKLKNIRISCIR